MKPPRRDLERMRDILEAIAAIQRHPITVLDDFMADELLRFFILKQIEIIGEAIFKTSAEFKNARPHVPWSVIEKTRHILVHDYFEVDWGKVRDIAQRYVEPLRQQVEDIVKKLS